MTARTRPTPAQAQAKRIAPILLELAADLKRSVNRRIESFEFLDAETVRRRVSLDLTLPPDALDRVPERMLEVVPIAWVRRGTLHAFDLTDDEGRPLPLLTSAEAIDIVRSALLRQAFAELGRRPCSAVWNDLEELARGGADRKGAATRMEAAAAEDNLEDPVIPPGATAEARAQAEEQRADYERQRLMKVQLLPEFLSVLAHSFVLFVQAPMLPGERRIFKFAYENEVVAREQNPLRWLGIRLGVTHYEVELDTPANESASYHVEVRSPPDLEITEAWLHVPETDQGHAGTLGTAHVHVNDIPLAAARSTTSVYLRTQREGLLRAALWTSVLTCLVLFVGRARLAGLSEQVEAASTLLLVAPGLVAAYLSRPGEHALASTLLVGVRLMLLLSAVCAITAGFALVAGLEREQREVWWSFVAYLSGASAILVLAANIWPRGGPKQVVDSPASALRS